MFRQQQENVEVSKSRQQPASMQATRRVTPAALRSLMPPVRDEENECFAWNQRKCAEMMEVDARNRKWETTYTVPDIDTFEVHVLDAVFQRLGKWLRNESFNVRADSTKPRSLIVSWDPARTPDSISQQERQNPKSNAMIRLRTMQRASRASSNVFNHANDETNESFEDNDGFTPSGQAIMYPSSRSFQQQHQQQQAAQRFAPSWQEPIGSQAQQWLFSQLMESAQVQAARMMQQQRFQQEMQQRLLQEGGGESESRAERAANVAGAQAASLADAVRIMQEEQEKNGKKQVEQEEEEKTEGKE